MKTIKPLVSGPFTALIVENDPDIQVMYKECLRNLCRVLSAISTAEAKELFNQFRDSIRIVVMDGVVPGPVSTTDLVREIKKKSSGCFIFVASDNPKLVKELIAAGCDTWTTHKETVGRVVNRLILKMKQSSSELAPVSHSPF